MTLATNDLYTESTRGPLKRIQPANGPGAVRTRAFAGGTLLLPVGTACYVVAATGFLAPIDGNAALGVTNDIYAIVWPAPVQLVSGSEVLGVVMEMGAIDFEELEAIRLLDVFGAVAGATAQKLKDICRKPSNRERGIIIEGLDLIGGNAGL